MRKFTVSYTITSIIEVQDEETPITEVRKHILNYLNTELEESTEEEISRILAGCYEGAEEVANSAEISVLLSVAE